MRKILFIAIIVICTANIAISQDWVWAKQGACSGTMTVRSSLIDASGSIYVLGDYSGTLVIQGTTLLAYGGVSDIFLAKFNSSGIIQWAVRAGSATGAENGMGIDQDAFGNIYITGGFAGTATFNDAGPVTVISTGAQDVFIAEYNSSGVLQWVKNVGSGGGNQRGTDIVVDGTDLIIVGFFAGAITLGPGDPLQTIYALTGTRDFFISKYDNTGVIIWAHHYTSTSTNSNLTTLAKHDANGYFVGGAVAGNFTFDDGPLTTKSSTLITEKDALLFKVDLTGNLLWASDVGNANNDEIKDIKSDAAGNIYTTGYINGININFGGGYLLTTIGTDFFITKRNSAGTISWAINSAQAGTEQAYSITIMNNNTYVSGSFTGTINIGTDQLISVGSSDIFVASYDNSGTPINANSIAGAGAVTDEGQSIVIDSKGNSYVSGYFTSATITANLATLTNADGNPDMFLAKYNWVTFMTKTDVTCNAGSDGTATVSAIGGTAPFTYLWSDNQNSQTATGLTAGNYTVTVTDFNSTQAIDEVTIDEPLAALSLGFVVTDETGNCTGNDGAINMTINGGTAPHTQVWSNFSLLEDINGLNAGVYSVTVTDFNGCQKTGSDEVMCSDSWLGVSSSWIDIANWGSGAIPTSSTDVVIDNIGTTPIIDVDAECFNLTVNGGAPITINPNASLTVSGDAILTGDLTIESNNTGTGAFVNLGDLTSTGTNTINRYLSTSEYHLISAPISDANLTLFTTDPDFSNLLGYNEAHGTADWMNGWDNTVAGAMTVAKGYAVKFSSSVTIPYVGTLNTGVQNIAVSNTNGAEVPDNEGWNLVGNPFPSPIDWDAASGWTKTNIKNEIHCWNGTNYASYVNGSGTNGGTQFIPAMQGFMINCNNVGGAGTLSMDNNVRVISTQSYWKSIIPNELKLNIDNGIYKDEMVVRFKENSKSEYDNLDAFKMFTNVNNVPQIYSLSSDETALSINSFPSIELNQTVQLAYKSETLGTHSINVVKSSISDKYVVKLEDKLTGIITNLNENPTYTFDISNSESKDRFLLHFDIINAIENNLKIENIHVYSSNKNVIININDSNIENTSVVIYNLFGAEIYSSKIENSFTKINLENYSNSYYVVKVIKDSTVHTKKIIVH